jgi:hypothetical protein
MRYLYKYPQSAYPYSDLVETNRRSGRSDLEYELLDTGVFDDDRYLDVFVEYAKASPDDVLIKIDSCNRGPKAATLHVLATLWFRNTWIWWPDQPKPVVRVASEGDGLGAIAASHVELGERVLYCEGKPNLLFTEDETNSERVFLTPNQASYVKDGINDHVVGGKQGAINPDRTGTKAAAHYRVDVGAGATSVIRLRLKQPMSDAMFGSRFDEIVEQRRREADAFYQAITPAEVGEDAAKVMRQALTGMLWSKQFFFLDADKGLSQDNRIGTKESGRG